MSATEILKHEHQVILLALRGAEAQANRLATEIQQATDLIEQMTDFFRNFADRCHHAKEEKLLFPRLEQRGIPREGGPVGVMLAEHEQGRAHVRAVAEALPEARTADPGAVATVHENLCGYVDLLRQHIDKEDHCLFAMADQVLSDQDQAELVEAFERVEAEEIGEGVHERYHALAHQWAETSEADSQDREGECAACHACSE
jgi:hemerythrin-like domain-containing protein